MLPAEGGRQQSRIRLQNGAGAEPGESEIDAAAHRIEGKSLAGLAYARNQIVTKRGDDAPEKLAASLRSRWQRRKIGKAVKLAQRAPGEVPVWCVGNRRIKSQGAESQIAPGIGPINRFARRVKEAAALLDEPETQRIIENGFGREQLRERAYRIRPAATVPMRGHKSCGDLACCKRMKTSGDGLWQTGEMFFCHHPAILAGGKTSPRSLTFF